MKTTPEMLDVALRTCNVQIDKKILQLVLLLIEELEVKGGQMTIEDVLKTKKKW